MLHKTSTLVCLYVPFLQGQNNLTGWRQEFADRIPVISADGYNFFSYYSLLIFSEMVQGCFSIITW